MTVAGPLTGATGANDATAGTVAWTNPTNAQSSNDVYATVVLSAQTSQYLKVSNFGFTIPTGATILGIGVEWEGKTLTATQFPLPFMSKNGAVGSGTNSGSLVFTTTESFVGSANPTTYLWGQTWTPADINHVGFNADLRFSSAITDTISVDSCRVTITYTLGGGSLTQTSLAGGRLAGGKLAH